MHLLHFKIEEGNFGDDLNEWLWDGLIPGWRDWPTDMALVGVGTILKQGFLPEDTRKLVLGSGVGYGSPPDITVQPEMWDIRAVRGPRTAAKLGLPMDRAIVDPAVMVPTLPDFADIKKTDDILFVPHYLSVRRYDWPTICARAGVAYQSPSADAHDVIRRLAGARCVIAESMHAAILADAFRVPWKSVSITAGFNDFKWGDWAESLGMTAPQTTPFFGPLRQAITVVKNIREMLPKSQQGQAVTPSSGKAPRGPRNGPPPDGPLLRSLLANWAVRDLRRAAQGPFSLSDEGKLTQARERFRTMLNEVARHYGS